MDLEELQAAKKRVSLEILLLNDPANINLWLKDRIYSIEVFNKSDVIIKYKLPVD